MEKSQLSNLDAFIALNRVDDDTFELPKIKHSRRRVTEGQSFDLRNPEEVEAASKKLHEEEKETELEVIDVNADSLDHIKNKKEYVGQVICQCETCKATRFADMEALEATELNPDEYTITDSNECPYCHTLDTTYTLVGQVGRVEDESKIENDEKSEEEATFENDEEKEEPVEEESTEEEETSDETEEENSEEEDDEEKDGMETDAADDTEDLELPTFNDDEDDVPEDDTEEKEEKNEALEEDTEIEQPVEEDEIPSEETEVETDDSEPVEDEEEIPVIETIADLLNQIVDEDKLEDIHVIENGEEIFNGSFKDLQKRVKELPITAFATGEDLDDQSNLMITVSDEEGQVTVKDILDLIKNQKHSHIIITDANDESQVEELDLEGARKYDDYAVVSIEAPERIDIFVNDGEEVDITDDEEKTDEEELAESIIRENNLSVRNMGKMGCNEYWIHESIQSGEDLDFIFNHYVKNCNESLINRFKNLTGYRDSVDEAYDKFTAKPEDELVETAAREDSIDEAIAEATQILKAKKAFAVVYGYSQNGKFYKLPKMLSARDGEEYDIVADLVRNKYHVSGIIYTLYARNLGMSVDEEVEDVIETEETISEECPGCGVLAEGLEAQGDSNIPEIKELVKKIVELGSDLKGVVNTEGGKVAVIAMEEKSKDKVEGLIKKALEELSLTAGTFDSEEIEDGIIVGIENIKVEKTLGEEIEEDSEEEVTEDVENRNVIDNVVRSFKSRKELSEAVKEYKNNNRPYSIRKSLVEGYRYDLVEEVIEEGKLPYGVLACQLNDIMIGMNDEGAYMSWIYTWPDGMTKEEALEEFDDADSYKDLEDAFKRIYPRYHKGGLYKVSDATLKNAHEWDKKLGLEPIIDVNRKDEDFDDDIEPDFDEDGEIIDGEVTSEPEIETADTTEVAVQEEQPEIEISREPEEPETTEVSLDPRDQEVVDKLIRIAADTKEAINKYYGVDVNEGAIVADMIQDLRLISGDINPEQLEDTPINNLTKEMYQMYDGFNNFIDEMISGVTGTNFSRSKAQRLSQAIDSLDSPNFSQEAIEQSIGSNKFLSAVQQGAIPFIPRNTERLALPESLCESDESKDDSKDITDILTDWEFTDEENAEYENEAKVHVMQIASYTEDEVEAEWEDFGFGEEEPEDPVDREIYNALSQRRIELMDGKKDVEPENFNQDPGDDIEEDLNNNSWDKNSVDAVEANIEDQVAEADTDFDEEEYLAGAEAYAREIEEMDTDEVGHLFYDEYKFDIIGPEDEAEQIIYDAMVAKLGLTESCCEEFDETQFDNDINEYFNEAYENTVIYTTLEGYKDTKGNIILEGRLDAEDHKEQRIRFLLKENRKMNEDLGQEEISYIVSNNISSEVFEFKKN